MYVCISGKKSTKPLADLLRHIGTSEAPNSKHELVVLTILVKKNLMEGGISFRF